MLRTGYPSFCRILFLLVLGAPESFPQGKPPVSIVPEPYRQKFVQWVDKRSMTEKALNLIGLTTQDVGRSFALIAGVSKYEDIQELQDYLKTMNFSMRLWCSRMAM
jgi:hypothetical protein